MILKSAWETKCVSIQKMLERNPIGKYYVKTVCHRIAKSKGKSCRKGRVSKKIQCQFPC